MTHILRLCSGFRVTEVPNRERRLEFNYLGGYVIDVVDAARCLLHLTALRE